MLPTSHLCAYLLFSTCNECVAHSLKHNIGEPLAEASSLQVTRGIIDELRDLVLHALGDVVTSIGTTVSWKVDELNHMVKLIDGFGKNVGKNVDSKLSGSSCNVGRLMWLFVRARVYNFHGEPGARLHADESVYGTVRKWTLLITLLNPCSSTHRNSTFSACTQYLPTGSFDTVAGRSSSHDVTVNGKSSRFMQSTVVLNANVAFLSIQSVDQNGFASLERTPAQISSYLSILTSIGAIIIELLLVKQNRDRDRLTASDAAEFIFNRTHPTLGLETLAVLYSLPYAMLIWSMVSAAFSFMCFEGSSVVTRTLIAVLWAAVATLILWCLGERRFGLAAGLSMQRDRYRRRTGRAHCIEIQAAEVAMGLPVAVDKPVQGVVRLATGDVE
ncbi:hypothetical protein DFH09DRAFT_1410240 [Mycena vulgaris]|nr:hypothetical protein DFH09DRAFT_1410240 [Mycena vulgaris]